MAYTNDIDRVSKREIYKKAKREAKKAVVEIKHRGYKDLYEKLDTKEGEKYIFKHAKARSKKMQDIKTVKYIKDDTRRVLVRDEDINLRWQKNFSQLLNESKGVKEVRSGNPGTQSRHEYDLRSEITMEDVGNTLKKDRERQGNRT